MPGPDVRIDVVMEHRGGAGRAPTQLQLMGGGLVPGALSRIRNAMKQAVVVSPLRK